MTDSLKIRMKNEIAKIKAMTFKEKREYIWEYYKLPIVAGIFIVIMMGSLINSWFINPPKKEYLYFAWYNAYETEENLSALAGYLSEKLVDDPEKEEVIAASFLMTDDVSYNMAVQNRMVAMLASGQLDIFILDEEGMRAMAYEGTLAPLDDFFNELAALDPALCDKLKQTAVNAEYSPGEDEPVETHRFALPMVEVPLLKALGFYDMDHYLAIAVNSSKIPHIAKAVQVMYE